MELSVDNLKEPVFKGATSTAVALAVTFGVAQVYTTSDLTWTLFAVGFASFFSAFFSSYE